VEIGRSFYGEELEGGNKKRWGVREIVRESDREELERKQTQQLGGGIGY